MSNFKDAFTKEGKEPLLNYDDSAALYFGGTVLLVVLLPWTFSLLRALCSRQRRWAKGAPEYPLKSETGSVYRYCQCSLCVDRVHKARSEGASLKKFVSRRSFIFQTVALAVLWLFFVRLLKALPSTGEIQRFDPFEILAISPTTSDRDIKRAYRHLSLKHHPDRNPNDPESAATFIRISKAYQALTDEVAKANWEKYGNPDGPGIMKVGIGLPKFLVAEQNQLFILIVFFLCILIVVLSFITYSQKQKKYAANGLLNETLKFISMNLRESTRLRQAPEYLAASAESREIALRPSDGLELEGLDNLIEVKVKTIKSPVVRKNLLLVLGHMKRLHSLMTPNLKGDLERLLRKALPITQSMLEIAFLQRWPFVVQSMVEFRQCLVQAVEGKSQSLLQVPYADDDFIKHCLKGKRPVKDLGAFVNLDPTDRKIRNFSEEQQTDINAFCQHVPRIELEVKVEVADEAEIVYGDIITVTLQVNRLNLLTGEAAGPVHAPLFAEPKFEEWWCFLSDKQTGTMLTFHHSKNRQKNFEIRMQFQAYRVGKQELQILMMCDAYAGVDLAKSLEYKVLAPDQVKRTIYVHPEDAALDQGPTFMQSVMGQIGEQSSEEEDEIDEEEDEEILNE